ncbi:MAG: prepilin-type N-terminal cleavage/methylation domain-containing protein [Candidatus Omnitrophica bacterium]|nr:prepilin-type N-terminal cleavage/methylation domain-containing protein [Candidatus Omnitrophota bacterium]
MKKAFTLLELIVVIIILGILATLGFTQYTKLVENMRGAEAKANIGSIRKLYVAYYLEHGTNGSMTSSDLSIGSDYPGSCVSTNYFYYYWWANSSSQIGIGAVRCTSAGKPPNGTHAFTWVHHVDASTGAADWGCSENGAYSWLTSNPGSCPTY